MYYTLCGLVVGVANNRFAGNDQLWVFYAVGWNSLSGDTKFELAEMKIVVYCDELIERKGLRKVVGWEKGVKRGKTRRKEEAGV